MNAEQFREFADHLPEPVLLLEGSGRILAANRSFTGRYPVSPGKMFADVVASPAHYVEGYLKNCRRSGSLVLGAVDLLDSDGALVAHRCEGALLARASDTAPAQVFVRLLPKEATVKQFDALNRRIKDLGAEIQRRGHAERTLSEREEWLRVTLSSIAEGVIVTDTRSIIRSMNPAAETLTGWGEADAIGRPLEEIFQVVDVATRAEVESPIAQALRREQAHWSFDELLLISRSDKVNERPINHSSSPIRNHRGEIIGATLIFRDVSERRKAQRRIADLDEHLRFVLDATGVGRSQTGLPSGKLNWDKRTRELFFFDSETDLTMELFYSRLHPDDREDARAALADSIETRTVYDIEHRVVDPGSGRVRWLRSTGMPSFDPAGRVARFDGIVFDITSQKETEMELRTIAAEMSEANRRKNEFLAMLAHELRNPLAPLRTGLEILKRAEGKDAAVVERTRNMMERQLLQLIVLIDDLMDVSRISRGKMELKTRPVDLREVLESACEESLPVIEAAGHVFDFNLPDRAIVLDADPNRLAQIFSNLLNNAAKYTPGPGHIRLSASIDEDENVVLVSVEDDGVGIDPEQQQQIFQMFAQVDRKTQSGYAGLGIGLTLVKSLTEMHGGSISVASDGEGKGSRFTVRLPLEKGAVAVSNGNDRSGGDGKAVCVRRVLVVDDNPVAAESLQTMITMIGHEVRCAADGQQAVEVTRQWAPEVILMDLGMPVMSGFDAARIIRSECGNHVPLLVAVSGWGSDKDRARSAESGFDHHLVKPASPSVLRKLLNV